MNQEFEMAIVLVRNGDGSLDLVIYSLSSSKGFPIFTYNLPQLYVLNMEYEKNIIALTTLDGIYMLILSPAGQIVLGDIISKE